MAARARLGGALLGTNTPRRRALHAAAICLAIAACGRPAGPGGGAETGSGEITDQAGAVCGMLVRDQPAPRGQVLHHDGTRLFLCSLGDLLVHLSVPSPHGAADQILVEVLDASDDPLALETGGHPWLDAEAARYVIGVPRQSIMGPPVLAYAEAARAEDVAARFDGARAVDFDELQRWWAAER